MQQEAELRQLRASSSPSPKQACMRLLPVAQTRTLSATFLMRWGTRDFRGHSFNLAGAIVTGEGPRNGAKTEKD